MWVWAQLRLGLLLWWVVEVAARVLSTFPLLMEEAEGAGRKDGWWRRGWVGRQGGSGKQEKLGLQQGLGEGQGWVQGRTKTGQEVRGYVTGTRESTGGNQPYP